jgi:uncharacterized PurR-regulated membrane protein YhhQ (DUF165 family)
MGHNISNPNDAFKGVFGQGLWIIIGSLVAFLVGQILDVLVFHRSIISDIIRPDFINPVLPR